MKPIPTTATLLKHKEGSLIHWIFKADDPCFSLQEGEDIYIDDGEGTALKATIAQRWEYVVLAPRVAGLILCPQVAVLSPKDMQQFLDYIELDIDADNLEILATNQMPSDADGMHHLAIVVTEIPTGL